MVSERISEIENELSLIKQIHHVLAGVDSGYLQGEEMYRVFENLSIPRIKDLLREYYILAPDEVDAYVGRGGLSWIAKLGPWYTQMRKEIKGEG